MLILIIEKNKKVLELGCGIGTDSINFGRKSANLIIVKLSKAQSNCPITHIYSFDDIKNNLPTPTIPILSYINKYI